MIGAARAQATVTREGPDVLATLKKLLRLTFALCVFTVTAAAQAQENPTRGDEAALAPETILLKMARVYRTCRSYRDSGEVRTTLLTDGGRAGSDRPFHTAFVRPDRLRFQFTDPGLGERSSAYIVWTDGTQVRSWWDAKPGVRNAGTLQEGLGVAAGISGGSSNRVPALLLPGTIGQGPPIIAAERIQDGSDRGVPCFRIRGKSQKTPYTLTMGGQTLTVQDESITLWIDRTTLLLRKVEDRKTFSTYNSESITTYTPESDIEIPPEQLTFKPPQAP
jgi:outer membrane lipoprotein-sorting protein